MSIEKRISVIKACEILIQELNQILSARYTIIICQTYLPYSVHISRAINLEIFMHLREIQTAKRIGTG